MTIRTNLSERLRDGRRIAREAYQKEEAQKLGTLRAGNSGAMSPQGDFIGACPRVTHLRSLGFEVDPPDDSRIIMFQAGTANEEVVAADLIHTAAPDEVILRESEIPIMWTTHNGIKVTGRPDMVVCRRELHGTTAGQYVVAGADGTDLVPVFGVEIKSVASVWTSRDVLFQRTPKTAHLIQAAHYAWRLGVPFKLLYKQYSNQTLPEWGSKLFPKAGQPLSEHLEYNERGGVKNIKPFEIVYDLDLDARGLLRYRLEGSQDWTKTLISTADIKRYYDHVASIETTKDFGPRPLNIEPNGELKPWSLCDYCPLQSTCDAFEKRGYDTWMSHVKQVLKKSGGVP